MKIINTTLTAKDSISDFIKYGGGKAKHMAKLSQNNFPVPSWFCISVKAFDEFVTENKINLTLKPKEDLAKFSSIIETAFLEAKVSKSLSSEISRQLMLLRLDKSYVAVRSSGLDEDSADHSFAGQFSSFLFQKGAAQIEKSLKLCWASGFSERALAYRREKGLSLKNIRVGVVVQQMVNSDTSGVAFSRNPVSPLDRKNVIVDSVYGLGEGLVSGELDADHFEVERKSFKIKSNVVEKTHALLRNEEGGLIKKDIDKKNQKKTSLSNKQINEVTKLTIRLEEVMGSPQDAEWAFENGNLFCLQTRPITTLPPEAYYSKDINGKEATLWDNSNIVESYSGVTSPLTFSFANNAYTQVYIQFWTVMGVPKKIINTHGIMFSNMLGLIRGRVYYNLINWYRLVLMMPGAGNNKGFMETMMGTKDSLNPEVAKLFEFMNHPPKYSVWKKLSVTAKTVYRFIRMDSIIHVFQSHFNEVYQKSRKVNFKKMSLPQQTAFYHYLDEQILARWQAPIINDYLCMIFFGLLKKLTENWIKTKETKVENLQNDLLCGQGDLESMAPTKMLMNIAAWVDLGDAKLREWVLKTPSSQIWSDMKDNGLHPTFFKKVFTFLDLYGFRCVNELKLESSDLHDDPSFIIEALRSYVKMKNYSIEKMEERELAIKTAAEKVIIDQLSFPKKQIYFWVLKQTRRAVRNRENLRFDRTKIFGVARHIFRGIGYNLNQMNLIDQEQDVFYLTVEEILAFVEGRSITKNLREVITARKTEYDEYEKTPEPPERFLTHGAVGISMHYPQVLYGADLLTKLTPKSDDPNLLFGTSCCPGVKEAVVRVAKDLKDTEGLEGEILVTSRTDPGWVPLYPSCSGLLIERGSLLSHSAVVARELGIPTIVGISGGLMSKLQTGMKVRMDGAKGEVRIIQ